MTCRKTYPGRTGGYISTPMPLAGHDAERLIRLCEKYNFYSHAPRGA